jgi:hypothetical protein
MMVVGLLVAAATGFVLYARSQGAALPGLPLPPVPVELRAALDANDSAAVAQFARARCRLLQGAKRKGCYEDILLQLTRDNRVRVALGALNLLGQTDDDIRRFGHDYSHVIGINAWTPGENFGEVYLSCSELFQSGCYHGVIQAVLANQGTDTASIASLCRDTPGINNSGWLRFQCVHGIGHGLLQTYVMNLPRALYGCDMLGSPWDSESCYGGAFMEFIVGGRGQSHHAHVAATADSAKPGEEDHSKMDHGEPDHHAASPDTFPPFKVREPTDLLYPCSALAERYHRACYQMQAGLIVERTGLDFLKVAMVCETAPVPMRKVCYQGIGTYVSGVTNREPTEAIRLCSLGSTRYRSFCFVGLVKNFVDVTANPDDGLALCRKLGPADIATSCYHAVGEEVAVLYVSMDKREELCSKVEPRYNNACRYGAGLSQERPADLPRG